METINDLWKLQKAIEAHGGLLDAPCLILKQHFDDAQLEGLWWYLERLWSNSNHYKVESHMIITKALWLMNNYNVVVDFELRKVILECQDGSQLVANWILNEDLLRLLWRLTHLVPDGPDDSYHYEDFRNRTRIITDNLEESDQPRAILMQLIDITNSYKFKPN